MGRCMACGAEDAAAFCRHCGAEQAAVVEQQPQSVGARPPAAVVSAPSWLAGTGSQKPRVGFLNGILDQWHALTVTFRVALLAGVAVIAAGMVISSVATPSNASNPSAASTATSPAPLQDHSLMKGTMTVMGVHTGSSLDVSPDVILAGREVGWSAEDADRLLGSRMRLVVAVPATVRAG